jgi:hypothetical protein
MPADFPETERTHDAKGSDATRRQALRKPRSKGVPVGEAVEDAEVGENAIEGRIVGREGSEIKRFDGDERRRIGFGTGGVAHGGAGVGGGDADATLGKVQRIFPRAAAEFEDVRAGLEMLI